MDLLNKTSELIRDTRTFRAIFDPVGFAEDRKIMHAIADETNLEDQPCPFLSRQPS